MSGWIVCVAAAGLFACGVLTVVRARRMAVFLASLVMREFGYALVPVALVVAALADFSSRVGIAGGVIALVAAALLALPCASAAWNAGRVRAAWRDGFGTALGASPFRVEALFGNPFSAPPMPERFEIGSGPLPAVEFLRADGEKRGGVPWVVVVHGGGWTGGSSREFGHWNARIARMGYAVASVDYRLAPATKWPSQRDDVVRAIEWVRARASEFGVDPDRVVLLGRSAGGQIAASVAASGEHRWLRGCACLYSPFDLVFGYEHGSDDDILRSRGLLRGYLGGAPDEIPEVYREASPALSARPGCPPVLLLHGLRDDLVWYLHGRRFAAALQASGSRVARIELPWATHAFDANPCGPGGQATAVCIEQFLREVTRD